MTLVHKCCTKRCRHSVRGLRTSLPSELIRKSFRRKGFLHVTLTCPADGAEALLQLTVRETQFAFLAARHEPPKVSSTSADISPAPTMHFFFTDN